MMVSYLINVALFGGVFYLGTWMENRRMRKIINDLITRAQELPDAQH